MMSDRREYEHDTSVTHLLAQWQQGKGDVTDALAHRVYTELRRIAVRCLSQHADRGWQATELVNEAWLRLSSGQREFASREHFFALASLQMSHLLVDLARMQASRKRSGNRVTLTVQLADPGIQPVDLSCIAEAFEELNQLDARKAHAFSLTELLGMTVAEAARMLSVSVPTVERDLRFVRVWLASRLSPC